MTTPTRRASTRTTTPRKVVDQAQAKVLFLAGLDYPAIAAELKCTPLQAKSAVAGALAASRVALDQAPARILALEQVDAMHRAVWVKALRGDVAAIDRVVKLIEVRERLQSEPERVQNALAEAFESSIAELPNVTKADDALVASCRQVARQIDHAVAHGTSLEATKAMYLLPHLWNGLRELGATPAARAVLEANLPKPSPAADGDDSAKGGPVDLDAWKHRQRGGDPG